jgi:hypothetical protein
MLRSSFGFRRRNRRRGQKRRFAIEMDSRNVIILGFLFLLHFLLRHLDSFGLAFLEEAVGGRVCGSIRSIVRSVLAHECIVGFGGDSHSLLQLSNLHFPGSKDGSNLSADLVTVLGKAVAAIGFTVFLERGSLSFSRDLCTIR